MEMKDILDIDMGFEDEQLTLYIENIKGKNEDDFKLATAGRIYSGNANENESKYKTPIIDIKEPTGNGNNRGQTAIPSLGTSPLKGGPIK